MAFPQIKRRFSLFGSSPPPKIPPVNSPTLTPQNLLNTTTSQDMCKDIKPTSNDIRKSTENLEKLVLAADEYRDCLNRLNKFSINFSKCLRDYVSGKEVDKSNGMFLIFPRTFWFKFDFIIIIPVYMIYLRFNFNIYFFLKKISSMLTVYGAILWELRRNSG